MSLTAAWTLSVDSLRKTNPIRHTLLSVFLESPVPPLSSISSRANTFFNGHNVLVKQLYTCCIEWESIFPLLLNLKSVCTSACEAPLCTRTWCKGWIRRWTDSQSDANALYLCRANPAFCQILTCLLCSVGSIQRQLFFKHLWMLVLIKDQSTVAPLVSHSHDLNFKSTLRRFPFQSTW